MNEPQSADGGSPATEPRPAPGTTQVSEYVKPLRPLTRKQKAFVAELINNPKQSATSAAKKTYDVTTELSARQQAHDNLTKPNVLAELAKYSGTAELTLVEVMNISKERMRDSTLARSVDWAVNARQTADSLLDRVHGKSTQRTESVSTTVTLSLSLKDITV